MLHNFVGVVIVVMHMHPQAAPLAMTTLGNLTHGFPFLSHNFGKWVCTPILTSLFIHNVYKLAISIFYYFIYFFTKGYWTRNFQKSKSQK